MNYNTLKNKYLPVFIALLRIAIGWHFLYEGLVKILNPAWTAKPFLEGSRWIFGNLFHWLASGDTSMWIIDKANAFGLTFIGIALILGLFARFASWSGVALLLMYYMAYPPFGTFSYGAPSEGSYMIVNKNLVELLALVMLALSDPGLFFGLDMLRKRKQTAAVPESPENKEVAAVPVLNSRRELLKGLAGIPFIAGFAGAFLRNYPDKGTDGFTGATKKVDYKQLKDLKGVLPQGKFGKLNVSRMIMGCNLIGGWSHARDLLYTDTLFKTYNNEAKIIETLYLGEQSGINTTFMVTPYYPALNKYKKVYNGKMQSFCQAMLPEKDFFSDINLAIDSGADILYIQGGEGDKYASAGRFDELHKAIDYIKKQGFMAGMGAHSIETIKSCEREGIPVDFFVKTFHKDSYWSAQKAQYRQEYSVIRQFSDDHDQYHDNMWDLFPETTIEYMKQVNKPWIAFKVLAAGAIQPQVGFRYAFENGADHICVGMFDFQVVEDVNIVNEVLASIKNRERPWHT
jgi:uncharacterized membrane protein YphA (DoxX/SURF4 family)